MAGDAEDGKDGTEEDAAIQPAAEMAKVIQIMCHLAANPGDAERAFGRYGLGPNGRARASADPDSGARCARQRMR